MPALPSGTVTFLFTDIEGSAKVWEEHPDAMRIALARHDALMRQAIEQQDGYIFKTIGDAFCAAFHTAPAALHAAFASQQALNVETWPEPVNLKVRMALHTGAAEVRDNDYFGQPLNRVARLLGAGHGQQILLSLPTEELTRDMIPPACSFLCLGEHRLRDLNRPETVFQLLHSDLPAKFPPLRSLDNPDLPNNLPLQLTSFIGREKEVADIEALLKKTRLLTLTGTGGCGKTRLALQGAAEALDQFVDGVWLVELAPLADPSLIPQAVASVLNLAEQAGKSCTQTLIDYLKTKCLLLVLDNCEHVLATGGALADALLRACPNIKILASSREGLGIGGELTYRVPSLLLPDLNQRMTVESVSRYEAVHLFVERALFHLPGFAVTNQNAPALASVCSRLDGIPLAIELAAARVRALTVEEINTRLDNRFRLLTNGDKTALPRQQTLRALIDWSYGLLTAQEKILLARLSVFSGGWTLAAAEQVAGDSNTGQSIEDWEVLDLLTGLVDKSLVLAQTSSGATRYRLLETVRQYALDRLVESGESQMIHARHAACFLALAEEVRPKLHGSEQVYWLSVLEEEHDNLRQAITWYEHDMSDIESNEKGLRLGAALQQFWWTRGHLSEGRERLLTLLTLSRQQGATKARADALNGVGMVAWMQGDYAAARTLCEESLAVGRTLEDKQNIAVSLGNLGNVACEMGDYARARILYEESLTIRRELADMRGIAASLSNLGNVAWMQEDYAVARVLYGESLAIRHTLEDKGGIAICLSNLGSVSCEMGDYARARVLYEESLAVRRELEDKPGIAALLGNLGEVALEQGDYTTAYALYAESLTTAHTLGDRRLIAYDLEALASLAARETQAERFAYLQAAAVALRENIGSPLSPTEHKKQEQATVDVQETLGKAAFAAAWARGRAMTLEQVVEYALEQGKDNS